MENLDFNFNQIHSDEKLSLLIKFIDEFDINSIPKDKRNKAYIDYSTIFKFINETCRIDCVDDNMHLLEENFSSNDEKSYTVYEAVDTLKTIYKMEDFQFNVFVINNVPIGEATIKYYPNYKSSPFSVLIPDINKNLEIVNLEMKRAGYYNVREKRYIDDLKNNWIQIIYDPIEQRSINEQLRENISVIYHCSPIENHINIVNEGIKPMNEKRVFTYYQPRVYLHTSKPNSKNFSNMMKNIVKNRNRKNNDNTNIYKVYTILIDLIPNDIEFFDDPHGKDSVYTIKTIPYNAVINTYEIDFSNLN